MRMVSMNYGSQWYVAPGGALSWFLGRGIRRIPVDMVHGAAYRPDQKCLGKTHATLDRERSTAPRSEKRGKPY